MSIGHGFHSYDVEYQKGNPYRGLRMCSQPIGGTIQDMCLNRGMFKGYHGATT